MNKNLGLCHEKSRTLTLHGVAEFRGHVECARAQLIRRFHRWLNTAGTPLLPLIPTIIIIYLFLSLFPYFDWFLHRILRSFFKYKKILNEIVQSEKNIFFHFDFLIFLFTRERIELPKRFWHHSMCFQFMHIVSKFQLFIYISIVVKLENKIHDLGW